MSKEPGKQFAAALARAMLAELLMAQRMAADTSKASPQLRPHIRPLFDIDRTAE